MIGTLRVKELLVCLLTQLGAGKNKIESGVESINNAPKTGRPKLASRKDVISKVKEIIEGRPDLQLEILHEK